ncbi:DUF4231 domain-containing protein [Corynebacterium sp. NPDC060344]|uniref:DUF4231 domain-containing protein n=1 Tax=Corynebacterium sp. NPDC060344 TaxID=3347101 RepID=UPI00365D7573
MKPTFELKDSDMPDIWRIADDASGKGQRLTLQLTLLKAAGGVLAAFGGAITLEGFSFPLGAWLIFIGFFAALVGEIVIWTTHPEEKWYEGRAVAESVKTLAWRYAIKADPFGPETGDKKATDDLRERISSITKEVPKQIEFHGNNPITTPAMTQLRNQSFDVRKAAYIQGRTRDQQEWYTKKAKFNRKRSNLFVAMLILAEIIAVTLAVGRLSGNWSFDFAGFLGALIVAGTAWVAIKQYRPLGTAYSVAARELIIQADKLSTVQESDWPRYVADAEEAISREHTTWLASRTGHIQNDYLT